MFLGRLFAIHVMQSFSYAEVLGASGLSFLISMGNQKPKKRKTVLGLKGEQKPLPVGKPHSLSPFSSRSIG